MPDILFLTLKVFSATGGIEKVCRVAGKAMYEYGIENNLSLQVLSMHDGQASADHNKYFPSELFTGFNVSKVSFMKYALKRGNDSQVVVLSHINLLLAGWLIKKMRPAVKIILLAHGIEVWDKMGAARRKMVACCDEIVSVSAFTRDSLLKNHMEPSKCSIINNCLDPFLPLLRNVTVSPALKERYGFRSGDKILFTLTRLSARERYKGYDKVMDALVELEDDVKYLIAGTYDQVEKEFIETLIIQHGLQNRVVLAGYIAEEEVAAHFAMSDCYVMPSIKEGFGIVFIEAMFYNLPVIAGNKDGSVDALKNGSFGLLVDPADIMGLKNAILEMLADPAAYIPDHRLLMENFGYEPYKAHINELLARNTKQRVLAECN